MVHTITSMLYGYMLHFAFILYGYNHDVWYNYDVWLPLCCMVTFMLYGYIYVVWLIQLHLHDICWSVQLSFLVPWATLSTIL